mmetsp:Transcript_52526/g.132116  ORF Transcript_52526/g.132116 Transcript_52526/m.132116 type:complete len:101 (+) Transcript_52526:199-501(+)
MVLGHVVKHTLLQKDVPANYGFSTRFNYAPFDQKVHHFRAYEASLVRLEKPLPVCDIHLFDRLQQLLSLSLVCFVHYDDCLSGALSRYSLKGVAVEVPSV